MMKNDGGQAFPNTYERNLPQGRRTVSTGGMTLRDYFAGQALIGIVKLNESRFWPEDDAKRCYEIADAMIAERNKE